MRAFLFSIVTTTIIALTSCIQVKINASGDTSALTPDQRAHVKKYEVGQSPYDTAFANFNLYEITPLQIKKELAASPYTCVYFWTPHCSGPHCKPLSYYGRLLSSMDSMNVKTLLVSSYYEYDLMQKQKEHFSYRGTLLVADKEVYGKHKFNSHKIFIEELLGHKVKGMISYASYYLYKRDSLMSYGLEQKDAIDFVRNSAALR